MSMQARVTGRATGPITSEMHGETIRHASHALYTQGKVQGMVGVNFKKLRTQRFKRGSEKGKLPHLGRQPLHHSGSYPEGSDTRDWRSDRRKGQ